MVLNFKPVKLILTPVAALCILAISALASQAVDIQRVTSDGGVKALLVEDYTVPIISMSMSFKGGSTQDPEGKEGLMNLLSTLMDEGAGPYDSKAFQAKSEEIGFEFGFRSGSDRFSGRMRTLKSEADNSFELLRLALNELRFDADAIERMRSALTTRITRNKKNPNFLARKKMRGSLYGEHPYARPSDGTEESLALLERADIEAIKNRILARDNLTIGVVGAISAKELSEVLDKVFGSLPKKSKLVEIKEATVNLGKTVVIEQEMPQTRMTLVYPALKREHKDFFAAHLMNHILGGGSFSSWLYNEVRENRGLAYSASSSISTRDHTALLFAATATRNDRAKEALGVIKEQIKRMIEIGPTAEELEKAKKYVIGSYAVSNLDTSSKIAGVLVAIQDAELGIDYIEKREAYISSVTLEDVKRVAKQLLGVEPAISIVGPAGNF